MAGRGTGAPVAGKAHHPASRSQQGPATNPGKGGGHLCVLQAFAGRSQAAARMGWGWVGKRGWEQSVGTGTDYRTSGGREDDEASLIAIKVSRPGPTHRGWVGSATVFSVLCGVSYQEPGSRSSHPGEISPVVGRSGPNWPGQAGEDRSRRRVSGCSPSVSSTAAVVPSRARRPWFPYRPDPGRERVCVVEQATCQHQRVVIVIDDGLAGGEQTGQGPIHDLDRPPSPWPGRRRLPAGRRSCRPPVVARRPGSSGARSHRRGPR